MQVFTLDQVKQHASAESLWLVVDSVVYDLTAFAEEHPGGKKILIRNAGTDSSEVFWKFHNKRVIEKTAVPFKIGTIGEVTVETPVDEADEDNEYFGDLVPFGDPMHYQGFASPYYNESHFKIRSFMRKFTDTYLSPMAHEWDEAGMIPPEEYKRVAQAGILTAIVAGAEGLEEYTEGITLPGGVPLASFDAFSNFIVIDELSRSGSGSILYGLVGGFGIGLPPVIHYGSPELKRRVIPACLKGEARICLAITEPGYGSDVAGIETVAVLSPDKTFYTVSGGKRWITNGVWAKYFVTAVRTGGPGFGGISLLVIERTAGVRTSKMQCSGVWASGTSIVTFEDVKVPVGNLLGEENKGFQLIMANFNPERIGIAIQANRFARVCLEESLVYASQRKTFGTLLRDHPVIRNKLAHMARKIESTHAWIEQILYQANHFSAEDLTLRAGGQVALLKAQATDTFEYCAREASQIMGGIAYTRGGKGEKVERLAREVRAYAVPGGSEELMLDLGIRQSIKIAQIMGAKL